MRSLVAVLAAATLVCPARLTVTEVTGTPPVVGGVLPVEGHHHTDERDPDVSARADPGGDGGRRPYTASALASSTHT